MMNKIIKNIALLLALSITLYACKEVTDGFQSWNEVPEGNELPGKHHFLENDGIKVFLPEILHTLLLYN